MFNWRLAGELLYRVVTTQTRYLNIVWFLRGCWRFISTWHRARRVEGITIKPIYTTMAPLCVNCVRTSLLSLELRLTYIISIRCYLIWRFKLRAPRLRRLLDFIDSATIFSISQVDWQILMLLCGWRHTRTHNSCGIRKGFHLITWLIWSSEKNLLVVFDISYGSWLDDAKLAFKSWIDWWSKVGCGSNQSNVFGSTKQERNDVFRYCLMTTMNSIELAVRLKGEAGWQSATLLWSAFSWSYSSMDKNLHRVRRFNCDGWSNTRLYDCRHTG